MQVTDQTQEMVLNGLRDSMKDKIEYHNGLVSGLEKQIKVLQTRIDQSYIR
jgi:hypothetical protein